jgi:hypothetical protein
VTIPTLVIVKALEPPDVRVALSLTECGVNPGVYVPSFLLPTAGTLTRRLDLCDFMADMGVGEMVLQFHDTSN